MSATTTDLAAPPGTVWEILGDPTAFEHFVVGSRRIRSFDANWPEIGATLHHSVGIGPISIRDSSTVTAKEDGRCLAIEARFRPLGVARVVFRLEALGSGTRLTIEEEPIGGLLGVGRLAPLARAILVARNHEVLRRIERLAEKRG